MANETGQSNFTVVAAYVAATAAPYFRTNVVFLNLLNAQNFVERSATQVGSNALKFGSRGGLTMSVVNEAASATKQQYDETEMSITAQKAMAYVELTDEAQLFGGPNATLDYLNQDAGRAAADKFDVDMAALMDSFTNVVGTTNTTLTASTLRKAPTNIRLSKVPGPVVYALHPTQIGDLADNIITTGAPVWSSSNVNLDILGAQPPAQNGYVGSFFGAAVYETTNTKSINTAVDWAGGCFSPLWAIGAGILGRFRAKAVTLPQTFVDALAVAMYYNGAIWTNSAGVKVVSKQ